MKYCLPISSSSEHGRHFNKHWFMETWHHYNKCTLIQTVRNFLLCLWKSWCNHSWETASSPDCYNMKEIVIQGMKDHSMVRGKLRESKFIKLQIVSGGWRWQEKMDFYIHTRILGLEMCTNTLKKLF